MCFAFAFAFALASADGHDGDIAAQMGGMRHASRSPSLRVIRPIEARAFLNILLGAPNAQQNHHTLSYPGRAAWIDTSSG
jgi:hypothetical protein